MTAIGVCASAYNRKGERYDSVHSPPEVKDFIESVTPGPFKWVDGGRFAEVDTSVADQVVTATADVVVAGGEHRKFTYWLVLPDPSAGTAIRYRDRALTLHQGEYGLVRAVYGIERAKIVWPHYPTPMRGAVMPWPDLYRYIRDDFPPGGGPMPGPNEVVIMHEPTIP